MQATDDYFTGEDLTIDGLSEMVLIWREATHRKQKPPESKHIEWVEDPVPESDEFRYKFYGYFQNKPKLKTTTHQRRVYAQTLWESFLPAIRIYYWHTIAVRQILSVGRLVAPTEPGALRMQISTGRFNNVDAPADMLTQLEESYRRQIGALFATTVAYLTRQHGSDHGLYPDVMAELEDMATLHKDHAIMPDHIRILAERQQPHRNITLD
jgi:hypothetical protein